MSFILATLPVAIVIPDLLIERTSQTVLAAGRGKDPRN
jgi:hypothetical protein